MITFRRAPALWGWVLRTCEGGLQSDSGPAAMARFLGTLFVVGASIALATMALPQPAGTSIPGLLGVYALAYASGGTLLALRDRLPATALPPALTVATLCVTLAILFSVGRTGVYALFYVWVALTAAYFLTWAQIAVQVFAISVAWGLALLDQHPSGAAGQWVIGVGTVTVAAIIVGTLRRAVAELFARLADSARSDALTGLLSRRGFEAVLETELERSARSERPLGLLVVDLDDFKSVNERLGHLAGDRALQQFARTLSDTVRRIDSVARIGGEEFAVVLPDTEGHSAYLFAERLRRALADQRRAGSTGLSASVGVASSPKHGITVEELMHAAERALYAAKTLGRDRAVMYDPAIVGSLVADERGRDLRREENIAAVMVLAETLDMRDTGTARHSQTVARYATLIAERLGFGPDQVERLRLAGVLHDIGKIGVQDSILRKPGPLSEAEYEEMKRHSELGARILAGANLEDISQWVLAHHERPDGRGYPRALADEEIPLEAKILAVADSYEAMTSDRVYRMAIGHEKAQDELRKCSGEQFDPVVVDAMLSALAVEELATVV